MTNAIVSKQKFKNLKEVLTYIKDNKILLLDEYTHDRGNCQNVDEAERLIKNNNELRECFEYLLEYLLAHLRLKDKILSDCVFDNDHNFISHFIFCNEGKFDPLCVVHSEEDDDYLYINLY